MARSIEELERAAVELVDASAIDDYEKGALTPGQVVDFFQRLIDSGQIWQMSETYRNIARSLLDFGLCVDRALADEPCTCGPDPDAPACPSCTERGKDADIPF